MAGSSAASQAARRVSGAHTLRLDYTGLKKRLGESSGQRRKATKPTFVELVPQTAKLDGWVIEFESSRGVAMRIHWKATAPLDWIGLLRMAGSGRTIQITAQMRVLVAI